MKQPPVPETSASLHGRRAGIQTALNAALVAGNPTQKLRQQIADIDRDLAVRAHADAVAAEAIQREADAKIEAAAIATADAIHARREAVMADFELPTEKPMSRDAIDHASADLERFNVELADATAAQAAAQTEATAITARIADLEGQRQDIVSRRAAGDQRTSDGAKLAEIGADLEGLQTMTESATARLNEARKGVASCSAKRNGAAAELSRVEAAALANGRHERLDEIVAIMLPILLQDRAARKLTHANVDWVAPYELLQELQLRAGQRPDLSTAGRPGSRFPARPPGLRRTA